MYIALKGDEKSEPDLKEIRLSFLFLRIGMFFQKRRRREMVRGIVVMR